MSMVPDELFAGTDQAFAEASNETLAPAIPGRVLHLDGDILCYWASGSSTCPLGEAKANSLRKVLSLMRKTHSESCVVHLTSRASTKGDRYLIAYTKPYQGHRSGKTKPKNFDPLREYWECFKPEQAITVKQWYKREADDGMVACAWRAAELQQWRSLDDYGLPNVAIMSGDKDLRMCLGDHYNIEGSHLAAVHKGEYAVTGADGKLYGEAWFWHQMLSGDAADNIAGLPGYINPAGRRITGFGESKATQALEDIRDAAAAADKVAQLYHEWYGEEWLDRFTEAALLLWLRRDAAGSIKDFATYMATIHGPYDSAISVAAASERIENKVKEAYAQAQTF